MEKKDGVYLKDGGYLLRLFTSRNNLNNILTGTAICFVLYKEPLHKKNVFKEYLCKLKNPGNR